MKTEKKLPKTPKTYKDLVALLEHTGVDDQVCRDEVPVQCGALFISELENHTPKEQAIQLVDILEDGNHVAQIVFSDRVDSKRWAATKRLSYKGPISTNPSSGNKIRFYIFIPSTRNLLKLYRSKA